MALPLLTAAIPTLFKLGAGLNQIRKGKAMNPQRPEYNIPQGITDNTAMYRARANTQRLAGQSMYENQIDSGQANNLNALMSGGASGAALAASANAMNSASAGSVNKLAQMGMQNQQNNQQLLAGANQQQAVYEDKAWDWNKKDKFQEEAASRAALLQAGNTQLYQGMDNLANNYVQSPAMQAAGDAGWDKLKGGIQGLFQRRQARVNGDVSAGFGQQQQPFGIAGGTTRSQQPFGMNYNNPFS